MRIAFVVDARSPIALSWIAHFTGRGHDVRVISTYPSSTLALPGITILQCPIGLTNLSHMLPAPNKESNGRQSIQKKILSGLQKNAGLSKRLRTLRDTVTSIELYRHVGRIRQSLAEFKPDLVHAMRIPFEGILTSEAVPDGIPLVLSVWGNDFTLFARHYPVIRWQIRKSLQRAQGLHCDCQRDADLALAYGWDARKPVTVLPGAGGIQPETFYQGDPTSDLREQLQISEQSKVVFNPRGFRGYVHNETFFRAIPIVLRENPETVFIAVGMKGIREAQNWTVELGISRNIRLLPWSTRDNMANLFRLAHVTVSPSAHDGTPNTLLEAMACGSFPIAGDIASLREWLVDGENGFLVNPRDPKALAESILLALRDEQLREQAKETNQRLISERATYSTVMNRAERFCADLVGQTAVVR